MKYWELLNEIKFVFSFSVFSLKKFIFHCSETYFLYFHWSPGRLLSSSKELVDNTQFKGKVLWYENYHISFVVIATREIFFIPLDENISCIFWKKKLEYPLYISEAEKDSYDNGVIFYLRDGEVVGVVLWNLPGFIGDPTRIDIAKQVCQSFVTLVYQCLVFSQY